MKTIVLMISLMLGVSLVNAQSRVAVKVSDLPVAITQNISTQHAGYTAMNAFRINNKGMMTYEVFAKKDNDMLKLMYDKDGKFMRMTQRKTGQNGMMHSNHQMHGNMQQNHMSKVSNAKKQSDPPNVPPNAKPDNNRK